MNASTEASALHPWQRTADGAGLLAADGTITETIFAEMSALAVRTDAVNLGQGFPDEDGPPEVLEAARQAISDGRNQYPPGRGTRDLREAVARHQRRWYGIELNPATEVLAAAGATEGLAAALLALVDTGDEVVTFSPFYDAYGALVARAGGVLRTVSLPFPDWRPDLDELRATVTDQTRVIIVNTPHNPTGATFDGELLELIVELANRHDAIIVTDEVYEHLVFDGRHAPIASLPGAFERTVSISSGGKTFNTTGWKVGWLTGPARLLDRILAVKQYLTYSNAAPLQPAIAVGLDLDSSFFIRTATTLRCRRDVLATGLEEAGFTFSLPAAGYFIVADAAPLGFDDATVLCRRLPELAGVVAVPVSAFAQPAKRGEVASLVRFAFCKRPELLDEASARLSRLSARSH